MLRINKEVCVEMTVFDILTLVFGVSLFLFGMSLMGDALKRNAGNKLKLFLIVLLAGTLLTFLLCIKTGMDNKEYLQGLKRMPVGEGEQEVILKAKVGKEQEEIPFMVTERQLTPQELEKLFEECLSRLESLMPGENTNLNQIQSNLYLPDSLEDYPFEIIWYCHNFH